MSKIEWTERKIQRCLYWRHRSSALCILPNWTPSEWYECDLFVLTGSMFSIEYEIKLTVSDFKADFKKTSKHAHLARPDTFMNRPTRFFYATPEGLVGESEIPPYAGLVYITSDGVERIIRRAPRLRDKPHPEDVLKAMRRTSCYRFWNERLRLDDYYELVERDFCRRTPETSP